MSDELDLVEGAELIENLMTPEEPEVEEAPEPVQAETNEEAPAQLQQTQEQLATYEAQIINAAHELQAAERETNALRKSNPGEYAARKSDIQERRNQLNQAYQQVQHAAGQLTDGVVEQHQKHLEAERQKLQEAIPDWNEEKQAKLVSYLKDKGYTAQQLASVTSARDVQIAWNSMQAESGETKKPLPKIPKVPGRKKQQATIEERAKKANIRPGSIAYQAMKIQELI